MVKDETLSHSLTNPLDRCTAEHTVGGPVGINVQVPAVVSQLLIHSVILIECVVTV